MEVILILCLTLLLGSALFFSLRLIKWILRSKRRTQLVSGFLAVCVLAIVIDHTLFRHMQLIQSAVYPNLYLVKYPEDNQEALKQAIRNAVTAHLRVDWPNGKKLAYQKENAIFFYAYYKALPFSIFQDEGTAYFLDSEEDLGGLITEELGMYERYKLADFHYAPCASNTALRCGELRFFNAQGLVDSERRGNLPSPRNTQ
ncbi:hypothetical protein [Halopseudomonas sp.]|uniref:hypothetical protein n=1 Tax=Halopseudomonas sp. TaxID=2901191 RepID=UPI00311ED282